MQIWVEWWQTIILVVVLCWLALRRRWRWALAWQGQCVSCDWIWIWWGSWTREMQRAWCWISWILLQLWVWASIHLGPLNLLFTPPYQCPAFIFYLFSLLFIIWFIIVLSFLILENITHTLDFISHFQIFFIAWLIDF